MNKVKWRFSLILAFFIVGILSTAAFASDPYNLKTVQKDSGLEVSFTGNSNDVTDIEGRQFDLVLKDGPTIVKTYGPLALNSSKQGTFNIPSSDLTAGKVYNVELYHTDDSNHVTLLSSASARITTDSHNNRMYHGDDPKLDVNGNGLANANETGLNKTSKAKTGQSVHGFYENNTNSCASCHQTHTAADGEYLLFKDGTYSTCSACHDGTTGAYNSFAPTTDETKDTIAGTFDVSADAAHGSLHQSDGSLQISTAPGGNNNPDTSSDSIGYNTWGQDFTCASCHAPHGGGSAAENNLNLDPLGWGGITYNPQTKDGKNGKLFKDIEIFNESSIPTSLTGHKPYILVKKIATNTDVVNDRKLYSYLYARAGVKEGDTILQTYKWTGTPVVKDGETYFGYQPDYSLWLRDNGHVNAPFENANSAFKSGGEKGTDLTANFNVVWRDGFLWISQDNSSALTLLGTIDYAQISIGLDVETTVNMTSLYDTSDPNYTFDSGTQMANYCSACHTDYAIDPETGEPGTLTGYHRHTNIVNDQGKAIQGVSDQLTCVRCHFAHGTKADIMKDKSGQKATTADTISDTNHSSALRRYIDMDSCYSSGCHNNTDNTSKLYLDWSY